MQFSERGLFFGRALAISDWSRSPGLWCQVSQNLWLWLWLVVVLQETQLLTEVPVSRGFLEGRFAFAGN